MFSSEPSDREGLKPATGAPPIFSGKWSPRGATAYSPAPAPPARTTKPASSSGSGMPPPPLLLELEVGTLVLGEGRLVNPPPSGTGDPAASGLGAGVGGRVPIR